MSKLQLIYYPNPLLSKPTEAVTEITDSIKNLVDDMIVTMYAEKGIGLAAPQIGKNLRITVVDVSEEQNQPIALINPEIIHFENTVDSEEGCLSIPGYKDNIKRKEFVTVKALNTKGEEFEIDASGLLSRCLQHEIDHLDGVLFIDHLSRLKKQLFLKWFKKQDFSTENE